MMQGLWERWLVESIVVTWRELLLVGLIILTVYIAEMLLLMRGGWLRGKKPAEVDEVLRDELEILRQRLDALEQRLNPGQTEPEPEPARKTDASPYNRAIQMARQGFDAARISERCGISRGEADLIVTMHKET